MSSPESSTTSANQEEEEQEQLPLGWEKHEDDDGPYYWHIKSGTIQREPPENNKESQQPALNFKRQIVQEAEVVIYNSYKI